MERWGAWTSRAGAFHAWEQGNYSRFDARRPRAATAWIVPPASRAGQRISVDPAKGRGGLPCGRESLRGLTPPPHRCGPLERRRPVSAPTRRSSSPTRRRRAVFSASNRATVAAVSSARACRQRAMRHRGEQTRCGRRPVRGRPQTPHRPRSGGVRTSPGATSGPGPGVDPCLSRRGRWRAGARSPMGSGYATRARVPERDTKGITVPSGTPATHLGGAALDDEGGLQWAKPLGVRACAYRTIMITQIGPSRSPGSVDRDHRDRHRDHADRSIVITPPPVLGRASSLGRMAGA